MFAPQRVEPDRRRTVRERRASTRAPFVASVRSARMRDGEEELALALDLSPTGMRLRRCTTDPQRTALVRLEFELPDGGEPIVAAGRLLFEERDGSYFASGVRFVDLGPDETARIARYVATSSSSNAAQLAG